MSPSQVPSSPPRGVAVACAVACLPSGGALLAQVYGLASMQTVTLGVFGPCLVVLVGIWVWARHGRAAGVADALALGTLGGLLGTFGYDVIRVPFAMAGLRVFSPIEAYGVWIAGAWQSSAATSIIGWTYHFSNGITFGILYALAARGRHWGWGVAWAMLLETIALTSPFGTLFGMSQNPVAIAIAYLGHLAYGVPLGLVVQRWDATRAWLGTVPPALKLGALALGVVALLGPALAPDSRARDARRIADSFRVEGTRLNPDWVRLKVGGTLRVVNDGAEPVFVELVPDRTLALGARDHVGVELTAAGIMQLRVRTTGRTHSSFVIVEAAERLP